LGHHFAPPTLVRSFFASFFSSLLSPHGLFALAALDTSLILVLPFAIDAAVIILSARQPEWSWGFALLATAGSLTGASLSFWIGRRVGEHGIERFVKGRTLERVKQKVHKKGAVAMALPALLPPPFPLKPFILACGALDVGKVPFFTTLGGVRLVRFGAEAALAVVYGERLVGWIESDTFETVVMWFGVIAVAGTTAAIVSLMRSRRKKGGKASERAA
jgi:membrane protein YqaA with SNARE-associated domain